MAITATKTRNSSVPGNLRIQPVTVALDASYPTGGYTITPALFGFQLLDHAVVKGFATVPVNCAEFVSNETTNKVQLITSAGAEVASGTSLVGTSLNVEGYGS